MKISTLLVWPLWIVSSSPVQSPEIFDKKELLQDQVRFMREIEKLVDTPYVPLTEMEKEGALITRRFKNTPLVNQLHALTHNQTLQDPTEFEHQAVSWLKEYSRHHDAWINRHRAHNTSRRLQSRYDLYELYFDEPKREVHPDTHDDVRYHQAYAAAAYCKFGLSSWNSRCKATPGNQVIKRLSSYVTDATGFVSINHEIKSVLITFRGTLGIRNYLFDLIITQSVFQHPTFPDSLKVHSGFLMSYQSVQQDVRKTVETLLQEYPEYEIHCVGHSLGGALATIAAVDIYGLHPEWLPKIKIYSYGSPRVGNPEFADFVSETFHQQNYRTTHKTDIVPHYPLQLLGFKHPRKEHWINMLGRFVECDDDDDEDPACSNSISILDFYDLVSHVVGYFDFAIGPWC